MDIENGILTLDCGVEFASPGLSFKAMVDRLGRIGINDVTHYKADAQSDILWIRGIDIFGSHINAVVYYNYNALSMVVIGSGSPYESSEIQGHRCRDLIYKYTKRYPPVDFKWGAVWAGFNDRDGFASITFRYNIEGQTQKRG